MKPLAERWSRAFVAVRRFAPELREHRVGLALVLVATLATVALELARPWPVQWIVDSALTASPASSRSPAEVVGLGALALVAIVLLDAALDYLAAVHTNRIGQAVARALRFRLFEHLARLSPAFHARRKTGDLLVRVMGDVPLVRTMLVDSTLALVTRVLLLAGTLVAMFLVDARLTLVVLAVIPVFLAVLAWISRSLTIAARKQRAKEGVLADYIHEALAATPTVQSLGREAHVTSVFARENRRAARSELKASKLSARLAASVDSLFGACTAVALFYGGSRVLEGHLSTGELLVFLAYVRSLLKPVRATSKHSERVAKGLASAERMLEILDAPVAIQSGAAHLVPAAHPRQLVFRGVRFRYEGDVEALRGFDATFRRGELTGLFGASGSGKSTVAALAARLYDPHEGTIELDGVALADHDLGALRAAFGLSLQDSVLFGVSIRENLLLGAPDADEDALWRALRAAAADEFVRALPEGLDTELGSSGVGLSGGEKRRLCLARTLLREAPIVVVDEPFSGLDRVAVARVRASLAERARRAIVVVVAHDLDELEAFDRIVFMSDGRAHDSGTHLQLAARNAEYRRTTRSLAGSQP